MAAVSEVSGRYVSSSVPKALMPPAVSIVQEPLNKSKLKDPLYKSNICGRYQNAVPPNQGNDSGDSSLPPVPGRQHLTIQTDLYLEELCYAIDERDQFSQTDTLLDRPPSPLFVRAKTGTDVETQIWTGELFNFDEEVQPLLECLINQTIEQSLVEIMSDRELVDLQKLHKSYEFKRNEEFANCLRLEEQERRLLIERRKLLQEQEEAVRLEEDAAEKVAACVYAQNYLSDLLPKVYKRLEAQGYFATQAPEIQDAEEEFWPWLMKEVDSEINTLEASCCILDSLIEESVQNITESAVIKPLQADSEDGYYT